jgi:glutathione S-transferase
VPCLVDGEQTIWDSLAIMEYLAEENANVWPTDKNARTWSRCASAEMHSGFPAIRNQCAMNCGLRIKLNHIDEALLHDVSRIDELWQQGLSEFNGPFLAGKNFTAVDAMFAPIAFRSQTFELPFSLKSKSYIDLILSLSSMQDWYTSALNEAWREIDHEEEALNSGKLLDDFRND